MVTISNKAKGVEKAKGRLSSEFILKGLQGSGGGGLLGRSKGRGSGDDGGKDSKLHVEI